MTKLFVLSAALLAGACARTGNSQPQNQAAPYNEEFGLSECKLGPTGRNTFFILEPGFQLVLEKRNEAEKALEKLVITVLDETREVDGVNTRVVEEREWINDALIEVSRNYFAICEKTGDVFYFGEEVDIYKDGVLVSHEGAWLAGENGAKSGLIMPGKPKIGMKYFQEQARGVAMDRAEIIKLDYALETPAGLFSGCLLTKEGSALNPFEVEYKTYAPDIGLIQDEKLLLTGHGFVGK